MPAQYWSPRTVEKNWPPDWLHYANNQKLLHIGWKILTTRNWCTMLTTKIGCSLLNARNGCNIDDHQEWLDNADYHQSMCTMPSTRNGCTMLTSMNGYTMLTTKNDCILLTTGNCTQSWLSESVALCWPSGMATQCWSPGMVAHCRSPEMVAQCGPPGRTAQTGLLGLPWKVYRAYICIPGMFISSCLLVKVIHTRLMYKLPGKVSYSRTLGRKGCTRLKLSGKCWTPPPSARCKTSDDKAGSHSWR
jgi:hypothetical protein